MNCYLHMFQSAIDSYESMTTCQRTTVRNWAFIMDWAMLLNNTMESCCKKIARLPASRIVAVRLWHTQWRTNLTAFSTLTVLLTEGAHAPWRDRSPGSCMPLHLVVYALENVSASCLDYRLSKHSD